MLRVCVIHSNVLYACVYECSVFCGCVCLCEGGGSGSTSKITSSFYCFYFVIISE